MAADGSAWPGVEAKLVALLVFFRTRIRAELPAIVATAASPACAPPETPQAAITMRTRVYNACFQMAQAGHVAAPHNEALAQYTALIKRLVQAEAAARLHAKHGDMLLAALDTAWNIFVPSNLILSRCCGPLLPAQDLFDGYDNSGNTYGSTYGGGGHRRSSLPAWTLADVGIGVFRTVLYDTYGTALTAALVDAVARDRRGEVVDMAPLCTYVSWALAMDANYTNGEAVARANTHGAAAASPPPPLAQFRRDVATPFVAAACADVVALVLPLLDSLPVPEYLARVEGVLDAEVARLRTLFARALPSLLQASEAALATQLARALVGVPLRTLLESARGGVNAALVAGTHATFELAVRLLARVPRNPAAADSNDGAVAADTPHWGLGHLSTALLAHVLARGHAAASARAATDAGASTDSAAGGAGGASACTGAGGAAAAAAAATAKAEVRDPTYVDALIALHEDAHTLTTRGAAAAHAVLHRAAKEAFTTLMNAAPPAGLAPTTEKVAVYINTLLSTGGPKLADADLRARVQAAEAVAAFASDHDVFERLLRDGMAARLLTDRSVSADAERHLLALLKMRYGVQLTSKMSGMLADFDRADTFAAEYAAVAATPPPPCALVPRVLTAAFWPSLPPAVFVARLPPQLAACRDHFTAFFRGVHEHRTLAWPLHQGRVTLAFRPVPAPGAAPGAAPGGAASKRGWEVVASPLQAALLLHADALGGGEQSLHALRDACGLSDAIASRILHSLACTAVPLLRKTGAPKKVAATDAFAIVPTLASASVRVVLPQPPLLDDDRRPDADVEQERTCVVDAALVRIMKARKTMSFPELLAEAMAQVASRFTPHPSLIKKRTEALIDREYLERDPTDHTQLRYLA